MEAINYKFITIKSREGQGDRGGREGRVDQTKQGMYENSTRKPFAVYPN